MKKSELKHLVREVIKEIQLNEKVERVIQDKTSAKWKVDVPGIKVFFDVTKYNPKAWFSGDGSNNEDHQTWLGNAIQMVNKMAHDDLNGVNHVGFVLSNGQFIDADSHTGVSIHPPKDNDLEENPQNYIVLNVGGDEQTLLKWFQVLKSEIDQKHKGDEPEKQYDTRGLFRQLGSKLADKVKKHPLAQALTKRLFKVFQEKTGYEFYCSELVANLLVRCNILRVTDVYGKPGLEFVNEADDLDIADEIDPEELYDLIRPKAKLVPIVPTK